MISAGQQITAQHCLRGFCRKDVLEHNFYREGWIVSIFLISEIRTKWKMDITFAIDDCSFNGIYCLSDLLDLCPLITFVYTERTGRMIILYQILMKRTPRGAGIVVFALKLICSKKNSKIQTMLSVLYSTNVKKEWNVKVIWIFSEAPEICIKWNITSFN